MIMMPYNCSSHRCSSQAARTSGTPQARQRLMPINRRMRDLIIDHADLLMESEVPKPLKDFCAHVSSLEIILAAEQGGVEEEILIPHPGEAYVSYVRSSFLDLKDTQRRLLRDHSVLIPEVSRASVEM